MKVQKSQKKYSFRTFKGIGLASTVVGMFFANQAVYADVTSGDKSETTVYDTAEPDIPSSAKTTFTDDQNPTKKVTVDAVVGVFEDEYGRRKYYPDSDRYDGIDTISYSEENTVNHLLNSDHSKIKEPTVEWVGGGRIKTPYVKKGIAYDTDGKAYRQLIEDNDGYGVKVTEDTWVNGLRYNSVDTKIIKSGGRIYRPTRFNDIEVPVSPEDMHYEFGGVNYEKVTSNVYIVEETSDGHYGKFVQASNITNDQEAVLAWKNGQATAKDFIKANVTLQPGDTNFQPGETIFQPGDTILVIDRDTYAKGDGRKTVLRTDFVREKVAATPENNSENNTNTEAKYTDWKKVSSVEESRKNYVYANKGLVTISDDLQKVKVVHTSTRTEEDEYTKREWTTTLETDYVIHEAITPIRAYKVRGGDNRGIVNRYYELDSHYAIPNDEPERHPRDIVIEKPEKPVSEIPKESPKNELPEFTGGVVSDIPPVLEIPEYTGGVVSNIPPALEIPEYTGGVVSDIPPALEIPEYTGGVVSDIPPVLDIPEYPEDKEATKLIIPPVYTKPTLIITKWVDENGTSLKSADVKAPLELGQSNEAFEHGMIEGYEYVETIRNQEGDVVTHVFRKLNSEPKSEPKPIPTPIPQRNEELETPKVSNKPVPSTDHSGGNTYPAPAMEVSQLPNTGTESNVALAAFGFVGILTGFSLVLRKKDSE